MHKIVLLLVSFLNILSAEFGGPSFDCGKAKTKVEKTICGNQELIKLDNDMNIAFNILMGKYDLAYMNENSREKIKPFLKIIKKDQINWLKNRDKCEKAEDIVFCVKNKYEYRIKNFFAGYDPKEGIIINHKNRLNDLCLNYLTQKLWMDSPAPVNKDNHPFDKNEKFYNSIFADFKNPFLKAKLPGGNRAKEESYKKDNIKNNFIYTNLEYTSFNRAVMCINVEGKNEDIYNLYSGTFRPYCVSYMNKFIDLYQSEPDKLYPVEYEETLKEFGQNGKEVNTDYKEFDAALIKKIIKNHGNFANGVYQKLPEENFPVDLEILSLRDSIVTLYASYQEEDKYKFGVYDQENNKKEEYLPGLIVSDPFFFRVYGFKYSYSDPKLLCRLPIQSRFIDINDTQIIKSYFNQFKGL